MDLKITPLGQTIVKPTALGPVANTDTKLLIYGLFQKGRVLAQDGDGARKALDHAVLIDLLGLPEDVMEPLAVLRHQWCAEPSVHGGKSTAPVGRATTP